MVTMPDGEQTSLRCTTQLDTDEHTKEAVIPTSPPTTTTPSIGEQQMEESCDNPDKVLTSNQETLSTTLPLQDEETGRVKLFLHVTDLSLGGNESALVKEQNGQKEEDCIARLVPDYDKGQDMRVMKLYDDLRNEEGYYDYQIVMTFVDNTNETALL